MKKTSYINLILAVVACFCLSRCHEKKQVLTISNSVVSLSPPAGFIQDPTFSGFKHEKLRATIMMVEMPRPFNMETGFTEGDSAINGMKVISRKQVEVDGRKGLLCQLNRKAAMRDFTQWMLVLPNSNYTTAVSGTYLTKDEETLSTPIKESLLTVHIGDNEKQLLQSLPFEVTMNDGSFYLAKVLSTPSVIYTKDGIWSDSSMSSTSLYAGRSLHSKKQIAATERYALEHFVKMCPDCMVDSVTNIKVDSLSGFEVWGRSGSTQKLKYQSMLFEDHTYYLIVGTAIDNQDQNLATFRSVMKTFKRRNEKKGLLALK